MTPPVKINLASFDYYILKLSPDATAEQIYDKLVHLRKLDAFGRYLVIEFDGKISPEKQTEIIRLIKVNAEKLMFELKFILANEFALMKNIADIPVVELSLNLKSTPVSNPVLRIEEPIRSGIKIENDGDIVILNLVSHNAEIISGGNIHVYGDARGRLVAGRYGDKSARIFVQKFNPELISIAGIYKALDEKLPEHLLNKPAQVFLDDKDRLNVVAL
ncbi:septum site-determining protein MinC [Aquella oligotrophica]|nr:septum site-determining protein MinC [Aquella oligotrophica]